MDSSAAKFTQQKTKISRIKEEIQYLYMKKQQLNHRLYYLHLSLANTWGNTWHYIQYTIEEKCESLLLICIHRTQRG